MNARRVLGFALCLGLACGANFVPHKLDGVRIEEHLGTNLAAVAASFLDENGKPAAFASYFDGRRPVILVVAYFNCPMLCGLVQGAVVSGLNGQTLAAGRDFRIITLSMDPKDTPGEAMKYATRYRDALNRREGDGAWACLTGETPEIRKVTDAAGFYYRYDEQSGEYLHAAGIFILTPTGRVSRVFTGAQYKGFDLRLALTEAKDNITRSAAEHFLLYCYQYDPKADGYAFKALTLMRFGGILFVLCMALAFIALTRPKKKIEARP